MRSDRNRGTTVSLVTTGKNVYYVFYERIVTQGIREG